MTTKTWSEMNCMVCRGRGTTYLEHADGSPASEEVCPYCHGRKVGTWVRERHEVRLNRTRTIKALIWSYGAALILTFTGQPFHAFWTSTMHIKVLHFLLFIVFVGGLVWIYEHPTRVKKARKPNPMTTNREKFMAGGLIGAAALKHEINRRYPRR
jgi:hypothetical protein